MEAFLVKYDDIDGVYAGDDNMGVGALNAAKAALQTAVDILDGKDIPFLNYFDTPKITQDNMKDFDKPVF